MLYYFFGCFYSSSLLKVKVPITFPRDCKRRHPIFKDISNDRQLCAGGEEGKCIYHIMNFLYNISTR